VFADFGAVPLANRYVRPGEADRPELLYPLRALVCGICFLVQLDTLVPPDVLFGEYAYFSSYSDTLIAAAADYVRRIVSMLGLGPGDAVVEIASNDGYLLQYFAGTGVTVLGIEPAANVARAAVARAILTDNRFFGAETAADLVRRGQRPRLVVANNVLAHVPDPHDFAEGLRRLLAPGGLITIEFHHLLELVRQGQFDAIYHEHFQYYSLAAAQRLLRTHGLIVVDVERLPLQGGSLRVFVRHAADAGARDAPRVSAVLEQEDAGGLRRLETYRHFVTQMIQKRLALLSFLSDARRAGEAVVGYGAAAKGATLLNYCGVRTELVQYVVDRNPVKQGMLMPGSRIPIFAPARVFETRPAWLLVLPWNLRDEIVAQMSAIRAWGGRFVVPLPDLQVLE